VRPSAHEAGFSIIEGLIAALLLLVVTLGILPLFSRAMNNNVKGNDSTRQANGAINAFETAMALPFNSGAMTVPAGTEVVVNEAMALKKVASPTGGSDLALSPRWELLADLGVDDKPLMNRTRTLRQYSFDDFLDDQVFQLPLDAATEPRLVHLKVVDVTLQDATQVEAPQYQMRLIQAY
ncbi:MAG: hypothetical protein IT189_09980, partial [Microbacteriaceae bacterium]|nr:hypothetical protein [Microbacteriaceae bacterium]